METEQLSRHQSAGGRYRVLVTFLTGDSWPGLVLLLAILLGAMLTIKPAQAPPVWFDEGVNLSVARNWSEAGFYGLLKEGSPVAPDLLSTGVPVIAPIALSFRVFGVGAWQGRLPGALFVVLGLGLSYYLARRLYNQKIGVATVLVQLLGSATHEHLHPVLLGRQALGEMSALAYLLAGFACLLALGRRPRLCLPLAALFWGLSLASKPQFAPFLAASLLPPILLLSMRRDRRAVYLVLGLGAAFGAYAILNALPGLLLQGRGLPGPAGVTIASGLRTKLDLIVVSNASLHMAVLKQLLTIAPPAILGLAYAAWRWLRSRATLGDRDVVRLALWTFTVSWLCWWVFSIGWLRYLFPALFLSGIFSAALLHDLAQGFTRWVSSGEKWAWHGASALAGVALIGALVWQAVPPTLKTLRATYSENADNCLLETVHYVNTLTPSGSRVETFELELLFLLDRPYHYPTNEVQDRLNRRLFLGQDVTADYDALAADPSYLVVGPMARMWQLYDPLLDPAIFGSEYVCGRYELYRRTPAN